MTSIHRRHLGNYPMDTVLKVLDIVPGTSVDGPGLRTSIYFAGCAHKCPGCHNPQSWDFSAGREMTIDEIVTEINRHGFNVTLTGGDPLYQLPAINLLARRLKDEGYTIWCYTGFMYEELIKLPGADQLLDSLEVIVDGPFVEAERDISLLFRGSSNQRLIDVANSQNGHINLWHPSF